MTPRNLEKPIIYLITNGATTAKTTPATKEFSRILKLIEAAAAAEIDLVQIREKSLPGKTLFQLAYRAKEITRGTGTRLLVNDRSDIAAAAGADGVQLATGSMPVEIVRRTFGDNFVIGVSTHSLSEAAAARRGGADFALFGPVFETPSKLNYGKPVGPGKLQEVTSALKSFPVLAIGGINSNNFAECLAAGAIGVAAITALSEPSRLPQFVKLVRERKDQES